MIYFLRTSAAIAKSGSAAPASLRSFPFGSWIPHALLREMIDAGVKTRIVCIDPKKMPREFAGRDLD